jgi:hypothetical protein
MILVQNTSIPGAIDRPSHLDFFGLTYGGLFGVGAATSGLEELVSFLAGAAAGASSPESSRAAKKFDDCRVTMKQTT